MRIVGFRHSYTIAYASRDIPSPTPPEGQSIQKLKHFLLQKLKHFLEKLKYFFRETETFLYDCIDTKS